MVRRQAAAHAWELWQLMANDNAVKLNLYVIGGARNGDVMAFALYIGGIGVLLASNREM